MSEPKNALTMLILGMLLVGIPLTIFTESSMLIKMNRQIDLLQTIIEQQDLK